MPARPETSLPAPTTTRLDDLAFFNVNDGYGLFVHEGTKKCTVRVGCTSDVAARFPALVSVASYPCEGDPTVSSLAFDDHGDGFLYGPKLHVTHDGGASWTAQRQRGPVLSVEALGYSIWMLEMIIRRAQVSQEGSTSRCGSLSPRTAGTRGQS
jgi:hypothetical protein